MLHTTKSPVAGSSIILNAAIITSLTPVLYPWLNVNTGEMPSGVAPSLLISD